MSRPSIVRGCQCGPSSMFCRVLLPRGLHRKSCLAGSGGAVPHLRLPRLVVYLRLPAGYIWHNRQASACVRMYHMSCRILVRRRQRRRQWRLHSRILLSRRNAHCHLLPLPSRNLLCGNKSDHVSAMHRVPTRQPLRGGIHCTCRVSRGHVLERDEHAIRISMCNVSTGLLLCEWERVSHSMWRGRLQQRWCQRLQFVRCW